MTWIFLIFVALPLSELVLLLKVGAWLGLWNTVGIILLTALVGATMWRSQGLSLLWKIRNRLSRNELPAREMIEGVLVLVGGVFFLTPGFITDTFGFVLLIPATRSVVLDRLRAWLERKAEEGRVDVYVSGTFLDDEY